MGVSRSCTRTGSAIQKPKHYPTLLEGLSLKPAEGQRFDGSSILSALRGEALPDSKAIFQYFPHSPGVPDWLPCTRRLKAVRIFHSGENGDHRYLLFNLRDDVSEKKNLSAQRRELVLEFDALIENFLADTQAVVPLPNPAFNPAVYQPENEGRQKAKAAAKNKAKAKPKPKF